MDDLDSVAGIPVVTVRGTPRSMGEQLGRRFRAQLMSLTALVADRLRTITPQGNNLDRQTLARMLEPAFLAINRFMPSLWMELEGMSLGSGLPMEALLLIHGYPDLLSHLGSRMPPASSSYVGLGARQVHEERPLMVLAWSPEPIFLSHLAVVRRVPSNAPASAALTVAGLQSVAGVSEARIAGSCNEMRVNDGASGLFISHLVAGLFHVPDFATGLHNLSSSPRFGGGAVHILSGDGRRCSVEISGKVTARLGDPDPSMPRIHTNHPIADEIVPCVSLMEDDSRDRLGRLARQAVANQAIDLHAIAAWFGIDDMPNDEDGEDLQPQGISDARVLVVADPQKKCLWVRLGEGRGGLGEVRL